MSKKFTNVIDRGRTVANKYNIVNNSDGTAIITDIPNNINVAGTPLDKNLFNPMQEGLNFTVGTVHAVENSTDVYELDIEGLKGTNNLNGLELFDGLTFNIKITEANTTNVVMLRISGDKYNLTKEDGETVINLTVGELQKNRYYKVIFDGVRFVIPLEMVEYNQFLGTNFGGLLGTVGTKKVGVAYYDVANKQMVVPKIENDLTYYESTKFIPISDYQTANKLENLSSVESYAIDSRLTVGVIHKIGNICILTVDSNEVYNGRNYGEVLFNIPEKFRPKFLTPVSVGIINSASGGAAHIETNGNVVWRGARTSSALYINAVYLAK
ncbi:hypothetical protein [Leptotrichia massiliensis]|uniref:hypothetical protein n=1 Tax=Leptotrichia massiliensis TaxID=1852388 RepID=UPI0008DA5999|nr:hypothetical protein [Leptotrichia massiliensis]